MNAKKLTRIACAAFAAATLQVGAAWAQSYPQQPIRFIVPFSSGGGTDVVARIYADELTKTLGQPVLVDNRPGAEGIVGTSAAAAAAPDGYTILLVLQATMALNPSLYKATNYDPAKDFTPIARISEAPYVVVVHPSLGVTNLSDLVKKAKAEPGKINYASGASAAFLASELMQKTMGIKLTHIPYKGSGPAITDLLSGRVGLMLSSPVSVLPHIKSGKLVALAVTGPQRSQSLPDLPTVAELGYPGFDVVGWYGVAAPRGTSADVTNRLAEAFKAAASKPEVRAHLDRAGVEPSSSTPQQFSSYIETELERWTGMIKEAGIQPQ
ncbi:Bug family tripartite tricarboxylate transporter substrate binding protein [Microvirga sp. 2MCAF38]|uniref:Bug family tripartite tricarboxylate transporter substrate binding protein n=1 Tax=Microvirga sp. 2MCAF38 TaxID=3232989 RepID=UPI003F9702DF